MTEHLGAAFISSTELSMCWLSIQGAQHNRSASSSPDLSTGSWLSIQGHAA